EPAAFTCALLNSQPMGFYAPAQLVQDARRHGVEVLPVDVMVSGWDCTLERRETIGARREGEKGVRRETPTPNFSASRLTPHASPSLRLGLRMVHGLTQAGGERLCAARAQAPFEDAEDLAQRAQLDQRDMRALAEAGALAQLTGHRRHARWQVAGIERT